MPHHKEVLFRKAEPSQAARVRALVLRAYSKWVSAIGREPMPMKADYERAIREHDIDLLYCNGNLVALIETIRQPDHLFIENIAVEPYYQGQGFGRLLMEHAESLARQQGLKELRLLTNKAFGSNVEIYQSIGFRIDRTEPFMGGTTVYMSKTI